eukprot:TRINITY_DN13690_c0_g1_i1.p1 TRINITY_DN13690_c0_g1~~TRINITY_DN13690_c0_g1_i1.p1  ORF type:complete len:436 (-),score=112.63 TRINITY_DN13690_c0_g1_i1:36-1343(-)
MTDAKDDDLLELEADDPLSPSEAHGKVSGAAVPQKKKTGLLVRAKKWGATRSVKTVGWKIIVQALGEEGQRLFGNLIDAAKQFFGDKSGAQIAEDALIIVVKVRILLDDGLLAADVFRGSEELLHSLLFEVQKVFELSSSASENKTEVELNPSGVSSVLYQIRDSWREIFAPLMQDKNLNKFVDVLTKVGDIAFLTAFLNEAKYAKFKQEVEACFKTMMHNVHLRDTKMDRNCRFANCLNPAVRSQGLFRSVGFCAAHHLEHYQPIFICPELHHFIAEEEQNTIFFLDHLKKAKDPKEDPLQAYSLSVMIQQWKSITSKEMRLKRAKTLSAKYLDPNSRNAFPFPAEIVEPILKDLDSRNAKSPKLPFEYFDPLLKYCTEILSEYFKTFIVSSDYERFQASTTLPREEMNSLRKYSRAPPSFAAGGSLRGLPQPH